MLLFYVSVFWPQGLWGLSSLTRDHVGSWTLDCWTTREAPGLFSWVWLMLQTLIWNTWLRSSGSQVLGRPQKPLGPGFFTHKARGKAEWPLLFFLVWRVYKEKMSSWKEEMTVLFLVGSSGWWDIHNALLSDNQYWEPSSSQPIQSADFPEAWISPCSRTPIS